MTTIADNLELTVTLLVRTHDDRIIGRLDMRSPYFVDEYDATRSACSMALPRFEWLALLCTLLRGSTVGMRVTVKNEDLLWEIRA